MIDDQELRDRAAYLGVPENQVRRDHLLSHLIHAMRGMEGVVFIGGTALNRTHLPDVRLSEDLDLHRLEGNANDLVSHLVDAVRLEFPGLTTVSAQTRGDVATHVLAVDQLRLQTQVIGRRAEWVKLPARSTPVRLKYPDLPETVDMVVPTPESFGAMKLVAWVDRDAPRDLFDLRELAEHGALSQESISLARQLLGRPLVKQEFEFCPTDEQWNLELLHQVADPGLPREALVTVYDVLAEQLNW
ncbi:MAG: nucleotidyl transferase AbiEii/AbiGii toxin family protein [Actinobacteria bacterium]|nr:nucleotidyl transferase AbiEii/AbiGii toxin family protein [Actinomycetota bacterium]